MKPRDVPSGTSILVSAVILIFNRSIGKADR